MNFSVLISVYARDKSDYLAISLDSLINQSLVPDEIVLVKDGPLPAALEQCVNKYQQANPTIFKIIPLMTNCGLGTALNAGLEHCSHNIVARMDADDQCFRNRFEQQLATMQADSTIAALGTSIEEFQTYPGDLKQYRHQPQGREKIRRYAKYRNPLNHPSVMFRKDAILAVGSYQDMPLFEDYYLWIRLLMAGYKLHNLADPLLYFRVGNDMIGRRSGMQYVKKEYRFLYAIRKLGFLSKKEFLISLVTKLPIRLLPKRLLTLLYKFLLRKRETH